MWALYYKFSIVRNPWDRMVSMFTWLNRNNPRLKPCKGLLQLLGVPREEMSMIRKCFHKFLDKGIETSDRFYFIDGNLCVVLAVRYENLTEDLTTLRRKINLPNMVLPRLKSGNRPSKQHYLQYYYEETREIVARSHQKDIDHFGYRFETP